MAHFAKVENGVVTQVIVADQEFIDSGAVGDPSNWIQTSYNTHGGKYFNFFTKNTDGIGLRKNFAAVGYTYDKSLDAFIPPKPSEDAILNTETCLWELPEEPKNNQ